MAGRRGHARPARACQPTGWNPLNDSADERYVGAAERKRALGSCAPALAPMLVLVLMLTGAGIVGAQTATQTPQPQTAAGIDQSAPPPDEAEHREWLPSEPFTFF